jgi:hypothetical protein
VLRAPLELCLARRDQIDPDVVESVWRQFAELAEFEANAIDVEDVTPDAVVAELTEGVRGRFLLSP